MTANITQNNGATHRAAEPATAITTLSDSVRIEWNGPVAIVRFDRGGAGNALRQQDVLALTEAARSFHDNLETRVVVLAGA